MEDDKLIVPDDNTEIVEFKIDDDIIDNVKLDEADKVYVDLIKVGIDNLEDVETLAIDSEHPRAIEVFSNYMKNIADIVEKRVAIVKEKNKILEDRQHQAHQGDTNINNAVFVGSSADLLKVLHDS